ncbi:hypothetical protein BTO20_17085 [Mycobacterium dioxanotrophicus]|uniref:Uncharacterized protein n=1 Tax=Mycobacterium dioxanotrophicus TaxID=482462 RepID=A0A1Y0C4J8_9MYCO|nr:hypothetical protein [Mycobacterium dioxanotrophicus]ART70062.1 hypothetical protein BTO20_17085 [Mycobacterium dioxanotrophicus]
MNTILYVRPTGVALETQAFTQADIAALIKDYALESLTSTDRQFDFWFSPSTQFCQHRSNRRATELLLATTGFTPKTVPLLRGGVVVATHDADGNLDGLSWQQLDLLAHKSHALTERDRRALNRRVTRRHHSQHIAQSAEQRTMTEPLRYGR